eukprot:6208570-Pleurochrysis_carterae.AAC.1
MARARSTWKHAQARLQLPFRAQARNAPACERSHTYPLPVLLRAVQAEDVDNDDGSAYYKTHHNFLVYGGRGMKNDYGGHDNHHYANVYAYIALGLSVNSQSDGHENMFYLNKVVMTGESVGSFACTPPGKTVVFGNAYFTPSGNVSECKMPLRQWQAQGEVRIARALCRNCSSKREASFLASFST